MKRTPLLVCILILNSMVTAQGPYIGTTLGFVDYLENSCGIVYKENGHPMDPFLSMANHGATTIRFHVGLPPFASSYSEGESVYHHTVENAKISLQRARDAGLKTLITFTYQSYALEDEDNLNIYVAPLAWQEIASDLDKITDSVYNHTFEVLDEYCSEGLFPEIVAIGGESTWHRLMPNVPEEELPAYDPARSVALHNAGSKAVRDIAFKYDTAIKVCFHMRGPATTQWWLEEHWPYGLDLDMIGISLYHGWNKGDYSGFSSLGEYVAGIIETYGIEFLVMETAQLFREDGYDTHVDILGKDNVPQGYPIPPTTETQKNYLIDITREVLDHGGSGVIVWGGEWVGSDCYIYADQWGKGSSWENKTFWDSETNLHDGVNWMMAFSGKVPVTFKVDMKGADTTKGIYITGDFENFQEEPWIPIRMKAEGMDIYNHTAYLLPGSSGSYYFLNDTIQPGRETVPIVCTGDSGINRKYSIPADSDGEIFAFVWSACDSITQYSLSVNTTGNGSTSHVKGVFSSGAQLSLAAEPDLGWEFTGWTGDTVSTENPLRILMNADINLTANFTIIPDVPVTFKVDMNGIDVSKGVYVTGEFPNHQGEAWQLNRMIHDGLQIYSYRTRIPIGSSGAYYFMNDDEWGVRESVPQACAVHWGSDRGYEIPVNSTGETIAYIWSSCEEIETVSSFILSDSPDTPLFEVYPNPVKDHLLNLAFHVADRVTVSIHSLTGNLVSEPTLNTIVGSNFQIDLKHCSGGVYLVKVYFKNLNEERYAKLIMYE